MRVWALISPKILDLKKAVRITKKHKSIKFLKN